MRTALCQMTPVTSMSASEADQCSFNEPLRTFNGIQASYQDAASHARLSFGPVRPSWVNRTYRGVQLESAMFIWHKLTMVTVMLGVAACAGHQPPKQLPAFERISIDMSDSVGSDLHANSTSEKAAAGAAGGFAGGAATGAIAGLTCGPFAWFCSPIGAVIGGVTGGVAGGVINGLDGLPGPTAVEVSAALTRMDARRDFAAEVRTALVAMVPGAHQIAPADADARVLVTLKRIELQQFGDDRLALRMTASMKVTWNAGKRSRATQTNEYEDETGKEQADEWIDNDGARFDEGVTRCIDRISQRMARDLAAGNLSPEV